MTGEQAGAIGCTAVCGALAVAMVRSFDGFDTVIPALGAGGVFLLAIVVFLNRGAVSGGVPKVSVARFVGGGYARKVASHEVWHYLVAEAVGGRPTATRDRVKPNFPSSVTHAEWIGFLLAGEVGTRSGEGCSGDRAGVRDVLDQLPSDQQGAAQREGQRLARRVCSSSRRRHAQLTERLLRDGRL